MYTWMFGCVMCAFIAGFGTLAIICTKVVEKWCEAKGIALDDDGVDYGKE